MTVQGITFVDSYWAGKPVELFLKEEAHHGLPEQVMKEIFPLMQPKTEGEKPGKKSTLKADVKALQE